MAVGAASLLCLSGASAAERAIDPTFLHRSVSDLAEKAVDLSTPTCRYKPIFGLGDPGSRIVKGIARFGEVKIDPQGKSAETTCPNEEQVYLFLEGSGTLSYGEERIDVEKDDFMYVAPGVRRWIGNSKDGPCRLIVMGFRIAARNQATAPSKLLKANLREVKKQTVAGHPSSVLYQLLMGDAKSTRDKIAAGRVLTSLFIMHFAPGGTNFPHHHEREEEIYLVLEGQGEMVAGGGTTGVEGRHPAKAGDAYFFRLNCTVGFYDRSARGEQSRILAVRSLFPFGGW
jgi:mannose-6-phosphate isomerase-like protein (cupin superfamily)